MAEGPVRWGAWGGDGHSRRLDRIGYVADGLRVSATVHHPHNRRFDWEAAAFGHVGDTQLSMRRHGSSKSIETSQAEATAAAEAIAAMVLRLS